MLRGFFILFFLNFSQSVFSSPDDPQDLGSLKITKQKQFLLNTFVVDSTQAGGFNYESGVESLSNLPVDLQSRCLNSGMQTNFSLRGSTFQQVLILLNGQWINDPQTGHHNSDIPFTKEDIKKIEVIPGASSSLFGVDALGGAINFVLAPAQEKKIVWEFSAGNQRNGYGLFSLTDKYKDLGFRVSIEDAQSKGFRPDTDFKKFNASLGTLLKLPNGSWENNLGFQEKEFGAYDFYTPGKGYPSREWTKTYLLNSALTLDYEGLTFKPNFLWRRHYDKFVLDERLANYNNHHTDMFVPSVYWQKEFGRFGKLGAGLEWSEERIISTNLGKHERNQKSVYLDDSLELSERLSLGFSGRWDDFSNFKDEPSGSFSAKYKILDNLAINFGVSRSIRVPSFTELYYQDPTTIGSSNLAAEQAWNYQAGLEYKKEDLTSSFTFFLRQEKEMIDWVKSDPSQKWQAKNITADNVFGIEYALSKKINQIISWDANYTYTAKEIDQKGYLYKYGPNYANHLINTVFNFDLPFGRQEIGFSYKKRPTRRGWLLMNAGLNYNLNLQTKIFMNFSNILNVEYQDIEGIPQSGRYMEAGLRLTW